MVADGTSGWRLGLLFPSTGTEVWSATSVDVALLAAWIASSAAAVSLAVRSLRHHQVGPPAMERGEPRRNLGISGTTVGAALLTLTVVGQAVASATGTSVSAAYRVPTRAARETLLEAYARNERHVAWASGLGPIDPAAVLQNDVGFVDVQVDSAGAAGRPHSLRVRPRRASGEYVVATIRVDFGDGVTGSVTRQFGDADFLHTYQRPGRYQLRVLVRSTTGAQVLEVREIAVR